MGGERGRSSGAIKVELLISLYLHPPGDQKNSKCVFNRIRPDNTKKIKNFILFTEHNNLKRKWSSRTHHWGKVKHWFFTDLNIGCVWRGPLINITDNLFLPCFVLIVPVSGKALDGVDSHVEHPLELLLLVLGVEGVRNGAVYCKTTTRLVLMWCWISDNQYLLYVKDKITYRTSSARAPLSQWSQRRTTHQRPRSSTPLKTYPSQQSCP